MAEFYPSEIARLVLGYLAEVKCSRSWKTFLEENKYLEEHIDFIQAGKPCKTNADGKSLLQILAEYRVLKESTESAQITRLSTPSKVNEKARLEVNQKIQTRSFISKQTNHVPSPVSLFRSPASKPTPRQGPSTQLNFDKETDSVNNNAPNTSSAENVLTCNSSPVHAARRIIYNSPIISRHSTCYPDSSIPSASLKVNDKNSEKVLLLTNKSPLLMTSNSSQLQLLSPSKLTKTPDKTSNEVKNSSGSRTEHNESKTPIHSTPNENVRFSIGSTVQTSELNIGSVAGNKNAQSEEEVISVNQNSSVVCVSSEFSKSAIETPITNKRKWAAGEWSPKRKISLPRRKLVSESPESKYVQQPDVCPTAGLIFDSMMENNNESQKIASATEEKIEDLSVLIPRKISSKKEKTGCPNNLKRKTKSKKTCKGKKKPVKKSIALFNVSPIMTKNSNDIDRVLTSSENSVINNMKVNAENASRNDLTLIELEKNEKSSNFKIFSLKDRYYNMEANADTSSRNDLTMIELEKKEQSSNFKIFSLKDRYYNMAANAETSSRKATSNKTLTEKIFIKSRSNDSLEINKPIETKSSNRESELSTQEFPGRLSFSSSDELGQNEKRRGRNVKLDDCLELHLSGNYKIRISRKPNECSCSSKEVVDIDDAQTDEKITLNIDTQKKKKFESLMRKVDDYGYDVILQKIQEFEED